MRVAGSVQMFNQECQNREQPVDQQAVFVAMGNVFKPVTFFAVVTPLVFDLPATLGHKIQFFCTGRERGEIG